MLCFFRGIQSVQKRAEAHGVLGTGFPWQVVVARARNFIKLLGAWSDLEQRLSHPERNYLVPAAVDNQLWAFDLGEFCQGIETHVRERLATGRAGKWS